MTIPRIIHRVWLGPAEMPIQQQDWGDTFAQHHPGWQHLLWTDANLPKLINWREFEASESWSQKSDILRFELLLRYGGVYVDTDVECLRPLDSLTANHSAVLAREDGLRYCGAVMGAAPGHPFIRTLVDDAPSSALEFHGHGADIVFGPAYLNRTFERYPELRATVHEVHPDQFYPFLYNEAYRSRDNFPGSYVKHHWLHSWGSPGHTFRQAPTAYQIAVPVSWESFEACLPAIAIVADAVKAGHYISMTLVIQSTPTHADLSASETIMREVGLLEHQCSILDAHSALTSDLAAVVSGDGSSDGEIVSLRSFRNLQRICSLDAMVGRPAHAMGRGLWSPGVSSEDATAVTRAFPAHRPHPSNDSSLTSVGTPAAD